MATALVMATGWAAGWATFSAADATASPPSPAKLTAAVVVRATVVSAAATAKDERRTIRLDRAVCPAAGTAA